MNTPRPPSDPVPPRAGAGVDREARSACERLRRETRREHERLHDQPLLAALLTESLTLPSYVLALEALYGFYRALEPRIVVASRGFSGPLCCARPFRVDWLEKDLVCLGRSRSSLGRIPECRELPSVTDRGGIAGLRWAVEGSTLGGRVVFESVRNSLGVTRERGGRFFWGFGAATRTRWSALCDQLEVACADPDTQRRSVEAARSVFRSIELWLDRAMPVGPFRRRAEV